MDKREFVTRRGLIKAVACEECGEPIREGAHARRSLRADVQFCSSACKQRAYRRRKKLFAPYDGDARAALDAITAIAAQTIAVTDNAPTSRNAEGQA